MRRRLAHFSILLIALVGLNAATAPAMYAAAMARAQHCCQHTCQKDGSMAAAKRCCLIQDDAGAQAVPSAVSMQPPVLSTVALVAAIISTLPPGWQASAIATAAPPQDAGPIFLSLLSLRL